MQQFQYYSNGKLTTIRVQGLFAGGPARARARRGVGRGISAARKSGDAIAATIHKQGKRFASRFAQVSETSMLMMPPKARESTVIPTETVSVVGASKAELGWVRKNHGLEVVEEGSHGKVLLKSPADGDAISRAFAACRVLSERDNCKAVAPNFLRVLRRTSPSTQSTGQQWAVDNDGNPGLVGADVHALAAWTISKGHADIKVAVLDEGVDTQHSYLRAAVAAERDFVDGNSHARPGGDDAHGTACAGIISSRDGQVLGLAPDCGLVAARIAKSDSQGFWIFDDFATADAIDWCWDDAGAAVLSNSWGGGPPSDVITNAFTRARSQGRGGRGAVVVVAAGNDQSVVDFPGNLPEVLTVGASNQWDERKTRNSRDGEDWWGSNFGDSLDLMAPGVRIVTTDIRGQRGYDPTLVTGTFNGTSSACPHVAAAAALMLSIRPDLRENQVREIINATADPLTAAGGWNRLTGHGRLNIYAALRAARRA